MKTPFSLLSILFFALTWAQAQESSLTLRTGPGHILRQDLTFSPFAHANWSARNMALRFERSAALLQFVDVGFGNFRASVTNPYTYGDGETTLPHNFLFVHLAYGLGKTIHAHEASQWALGGAFKTDLQPSYYEYGATGYFGYFASLNASVWSRWTYRLSPHARLTADIQLPLLSWVARSPYLINDDPFIENTASHNGFKTLVSFLADGALQAPWQTQQIEFRAQYAYAIGKKWWLGGGYEFHFLRSTRPTSLTQFRNLLYLSFTRSF